MQIEVKNVAKSMGVQNGNGEKIEAGKKGYEVELSPSDKKRLGDEEVGPKRQGGVVNSQRLWITINGMKGRGLGLKGGITRK